MSSGKFRVKGIYGSGMVLQRETTNCIFGCAPAGSSVELEFRGKNYCVKADSGENWKIEFESLKAGGPFELCLKNQDEKIVYSDVFVGEVWVNSGQSNAQLPMERMKFSYPEEFAASKNDNVRMITIPISWSFDGEQDTVENPAWICACPENIGQMSGTGYFFAKKLSEELKVPVGIVNASQGGSPISAWMSKKSLQELGKNEYLTRLAIYENPENVKKKQDDVALSQSKWDVLINSTDLGQKEKWDQAEYSSIEKEWEDCSIPGEIDNKGTAGFVWIKKEIELTSEQVKHFDEKKGWIWFGTIVDADKIWINGKEVGITYYCYPPRRYEIPSGTLKTGKNTITVRLQKNSSYGKIRLYDEKPYYLFTQDVKIHPVAVRNVEIPLNGVISKGENGVCIELSGTWKMKAGNAVENAPEGMFFEWCPTALYNAMLAPCFNYAVAGALWYQGESDAGHYGEYAEMLNKMIDLWHEKFVYAKKDMPFVVMQLPNWSDGWDEKSEAVFSDWALQREAQFKAVKNTENTALSVTIDAGEWNDLHPEKKKTGGTRAAIQALRIAYGKNYLPAPEYESYEQKGNEVIVKIDCFGSKLKACVVMNKAADLKKSGKEVFGFSVLYKDGDEKVTSVCAQLISDSEVKLVLPELKGELKEIRYLWSQNPAPVNLYSNEDLPVTPFRIIL